MILKSIKNQDECIEQLKFAYGNESPSCATAFRWFKEFCRGCNSLQDEEDTWRLLSAVILDNGPAIWKMLMHDNHCIYQMIQKELSIGSKAIYKIMHVELITCLQGNTHTHAHTK